MIVCAGEALIDMLPRQHEGRTAFVPHAGGAVFNTAIALGRLGGKVGFLSQLSSDMFGDQLREALAASSVDASLSPASDQPTTLAFVKLTDGHAQYLFYDENSAGRTLTQADLPDLPDAVAALHMGAISLIPEPAGAAFEALAMRETGRRVISLDPNIRANFISDEASHRARIRRMMRAAHIIKVSDEDMDWIEPGATPETFASARLADGAALVIETRGADGATGHFRGGEVSVPVPPVTVVDTVGAGDTFNAGVLHTLARMGRLERERIGAIEEHEVREALAFAARVAAVTVSRAGADPPWAHELETG